MKIAYIAAYAALFPSRTANSIHVMRMCEAFRKIGVDVVLYVSGQGASDEEVLESYGVLYRFKIFFIRSRMPKLNRIFHAMKAVLNAKKNKVDLVVSRSAIPCWFSAKNNIDFVFDAHSPISNRNFIEKWCFRSILKSPNLKRITFNSKAMKSWYIENGLVPAKVPLIIAMNGASSVAASKSKFCIDWPGTYGKLQVGYTGHLYPGRGVDIMLACAERLPDCDFHLIGGDDEDIDYWKSRCESTNVYFHGYVNPAQVSVYRGHCDLLLAPYQASGVSVSGGKGDSSKYMNPIKVIEYMASGKAIIASDLPAIRDCLPEGAGILVGPKDLDGWVDAIRLLGSDKDLYDQLCVRSKSTFGSGYTWEARARKLAGLSSNQDLSA